MAPQDPDRRIIIIGGGFGGVKCARVLSERLSRGDTQVVVFDPENHMVFSPLLADVVGGSLEPDSVAAPLRWMLPRARVRTERVLDIDLDKNEVLHELPDGRVGRMRYDHLVISAGAEVNLTLAPGMADHSMPLKTVADAMQLRAHVMRQIEIADALEDTGMRAWRLSFIIVGGGFTGIEVAGEINDLVRSAACDCPNIRKDEIKVTVIHSRDEILGELGPRLRGFAQRAMEKRGIHFRLNVRASVATAVGVGLSDDTMVAGATIVCAVGNRISPMLDALPVEKERGRLASDPDMRLRGRANVWAIGDCAQVINAHDGQFSPATGQFAERQGRQAAENILRVLRGEPTRPFRFKPMGQLCSIGGRKAVADLMGFRLQGFIAWFIWRGVYLFKLPTWSRRIKVGFDWAWELFFRRDMVFFRPVRTEPISRAFFRPGDYVFHAGEPAGDFFMIEHGEADVLDPPDEDGREEVVSHLGPGNFFGERALLTRQRTRARSVRATAPLQVIVMGRRVFEQLSTALAPIKDLLIESVERRSRDLWQLVPAARKTLEASRLEDFISPAPAPPLHTDMTFREAARLFYERDVDFLLVTDHEDRLQGLVTRTNLMRAMEGAERDGRLRVSDFMVKTPITVTTGDSPAVAARLMRDHGVKTLPVLESAESRKVVGVIRASGLLARTINGGGEEESRERQTA